MTISKHENYSRGIAECGHCKHQCIGVDDMEAHLNSKHSVKLHLPVEDAINPSHYKSLATACSECQHPIECIDVTRHMGFNIGNVVKYLWRSDHKGDRQEQLKKAHWYLRDEIRRKEPDFDANE